MATLLEGSQDARHSWVGHPESRGYLRNTEVEDIELNERAEAESHDFQAFHPRWSPTRLLDQVDLDWLLLPLRALLSLEHRPIQQSTC